MMADPRVVAAILRSDLYTFIRAIFPIVAPGAGFQPNWHIEAIAFELARVLRGENKRLIITVPPRHLKSICASVAFPAFILGHDPQRRIICVSYSEALARKHANDCRAVLGSDLYRRVFPKTRISPRKDTELEFACTLGGYRLATSVGGTLTGRGGNFIIIDDPMKPQDAASEAARESTKQWYSNTLLTRLDDKVADAIVVVMQRLHMDDLVGHLLEQGGWRHLNLPAIAESEHRVQLGPGRYHLRRLDDLLHPEREPQEVLEEAEHSMGSLNFAAQYQQEPVAEGGNLIKWKWFPSYDRPPDREINDKTILSWDTALNAKELSSYSVCVILQVRGETVFVLDVFRARLEYPDLKRKEIELHRRWRNFTNNYALLIENKGSGMPLIQDLRRDNIHAIAFEPKDDKVMRMNAQTARIEAGSVYLPERAAWLDEFRKELVAFPASRHSDQIDAFSQGLEHVFNSRRRGEFAWGVVRGMC
jgi:predicted phage terminase large subunit-like protein